MMLKWFKKETVTHKFLCVKETPSWEPGKIYDLELVGVEQIASQIKANDSRFNAYYAHMPSKHLNRSITDYIIDIEGCSEKDIFYACIKHGITLKN